MTKLVKYVCNRCGSEDVRWDAWAEWDQVAQEMFLNNSFDDAYCATCEGECRADEVQLEGKELAFVMAYQLEAKTDRELFERINCCNAYDAALNIGVLAPNGDDYNNIFEMLRGGDYRRPHEEGR